MKNQSFKHIFRLLFPASLWCVSSTLLWLLTVLTILWFNLGWCMIFSFVTFQIPEMWVNTALLASLLTLPQMLWRLRRTQAIIITMLAILLECNLLYARTYFNAIPPSSYLMAGNLTDFTASVVDSFRLLDVGFIVIVVLAWLTALRGRRPDTTIGRADRIAYLGLIGALVIASAAMLIRRGGLMRAWEKLSVYKYYSSRVPMYTVVGSVAHDLMLASTPLSPSDSIEVAEWLDATAPLDSIVPQGRIDNIILIMCESLESWPIGLTVESREITPRLNSLVADTANVFYAPHVVSQVGAGRSIDAQLLINGGMHPMQAEIYATDYYHSRFHTLTQALEQIRGAKSMILTVDKPHTWNQEAVAAAFGIDSMVANLDWVNDEPVGSKKKLGDRAFVRQIIERMRSGEIWPIGQHAFIQIVTYSGHNPFRLPEHLDDLQLPADADLHPVARRYLTLAHYTDAAIGQLVDYLRSRPDFGRTLVVITGDHEGLATDRAAITARHQWISTDQMVPLIILNSPRPGRFDPVMGQIDIYPSLLQAAGLTAYPWHGQGQSVFSPAFKAVAIDSQGKLHGDTTAVDDATLRHIRSARSISDRIIRHNMLAD